MKTLGVVLIILGSMGILGLLAIALWGSGVWGIGHSFPLPIIAPGFVVAGVWFIRKNRS